MYKKCPGADSFLKPHPEFINCPYCKDETEIWSDEAQARCEGCGKLVVRSGLNSCLDWCRYAEKCVGKDAYRKYKKEEKETKGRPLKWK